jgi:Microtubule-associated protein 70
LDKMHRQKVAEVEKLTQTVQELEEAVLAGGAAANAVRDYQRKVQEMNVNAHFFCLTYLTFIQLSFSQATWPTDSLFW